MGTASPAAAALPGEPGQTLRLSYLLKRPVADNGGETLGRLSDVIVRLSGSDYPKVIGGVVAIGGGREVFVPLGQVSARSTATCSSSPPRSWICAGSSGAAVRCCSVRRCSDTG